MASEMLSFWVSLGSTSQHRLLLTGKAEEGGQPGPGLCLRSLDTPGSHTVTGH